MLNKLLLSALLLLSGCIGGNTPALATVSNGITKVIVAGDGVSTSFNFGTGGYSVPVYLQSDIQVYVQNTTTGALTLLTLNQNYTVTLTQVPYTLTNSVVYYTAVINLSGGSIPYGTLPVGTNLILNRSIPYTNLLNITNYSATPATTWNQGFDRATMLAQQLYTLTQQAVLQPVSATSPISFPSPIANYSLCWDSTGTFVTNCATGSGTIPVPIPNSYLSTLTQSNLVNASSLTGTGTVTKLTATNLISTGNVGIGSTTPGSILDVQGNARFFNGNVGIGTNSPGTALNVVGTVTATSFTGQNGSGLLGSWTSKTPETIYQASTDLFIATTNGTTNGNVEILTDSNSSPSTIRQYINSTYSGSMACVVKKNDYYQVHVVNGGGTPVEYVIPLGS